jgi:hypothetical protein
MCELAHVVFPFFQGAALCYHVARLENDDEGLFTITQAKKPAWQNTLRYSTTPAYSLTNHPKRAVVRLVFRRIQITQSNSKRGLENCPQEKPIIANK